MGRQLIDGTLPRIAKALERIATALEPKLVSGFNTEVQRRAAEMMGKPRAEAIEEMKGHDSYVMPAGSKWDVKPEPISEEMERLAKRTQFLMPGETHTSKIRNALSVFMEHAEEGDGFAAMETMRAHLAAIDKDRYELLLSIHDIRNNNRELAWRLKELQRLESATYDRARTLEAELKELREKVAK
jgi:hypothetical protein